MAKKSKDNPQDKLINLQAQQLAAQVANWAAQLEFQKERMRLLEMPESQGKLQVDIDRLAFDKGQAAWENAYKEATLTGTYQGQPTTEWLTQQAQLTGVLNGQQTLQGKLTDAQINQMNQQMKLANDEFISNTTGYYNGQKTFDREKFEAGQAQDAWKFLSTLTGPENAFKQARAIGSMPGGVSDMMNAWAGRYALPGSTSVGSGGRASLAGLTNGVQDAPGYQPLPAPVASSTGVTPGSVLPPAAAPPGPWATPVFTPPPPAGGPPPGPPPPGGGGDGGGNPGGSAPTGTIPGRGFDPTQWNAATQAAVAAWNAAHPGYFADGSQTGYHQAAPATQFTNWTPPPAPKGPPPPGGDSGGGGVANQAPTNDMPYTFQPAGVQAPAQQWNYSQNPNGSISTYPPGVSSPATTPDITSSQPLSPTSASSLYQYGAVDQAPTTGDRSPGTAADPYNAGTTGDGTLLPNQINARNYMNTTNYGKELGWASFEDQGWDKSLAQDVYQRSLPKYAGPKAGSFAF